MTITTPTRRRFLAYLVAAPTVVTAALEGFESAA